MNILPALNYKWENRNTNGDVVSPTLYEAGGFNLKFYLEVKKFIYDYDPMIIFSIKNVKSPLNLPVYTRLIFPKYYPGIPYTPITNTTFGDLILKSTENKVGIAKNEMAVFDLAQNFKEFHKNALQDSWIYCWVVNKTLELDLQEIGVSGSLKFTNNSPLELILSISSLREDINYVRVQATNFIKPKKINLKSPKKQMNFRTGLFKIEAEKYLADNSIAIFNLECLRVVSYDSTGNIIDFTKPLYPPLIYTAPFHLFSIDDGGNWINSSSPYIWKGRILK